MKKTSKRQKEILEKLDNGWVIGHMVANNPHSFAEQVYIFKEDGKKRVGISVNVNTFRALLSRHLLKQVPNAEDDAEGLVRYSKNIGGSK